MQNNWPQVKQKMHNLIPVGGVGALFYTFNSAEPKYVF